MTAGLTGIFPGMGEGLAEWIITAPGGEQMALQLAYFDRAREPVVTDVGPVLDLEDVVGGKVCALTSRAYERDYLDTAAALERYSPAELIALAQRLDPGREGRDFAEAAQRLDQMPDRVFTAFGLTEQDVARLRERFAAPGRWSRRPGGREGHRHRATGSRHGRGGARPHLRRDRSQAATQPSRQPKPGV